MKKNLTRKIPTRKIFCPAKYPREKISDPQNTHDKKILDHQILTRKKFCPTKYLQEKISDAKIPCQNKFLTQEIATRKNFGPTKYPRTYDGMTALDPRDLRLHITYKIYHT